jgi:DNA-binding transcriptional LysR family regulator
LEEHLSLHQLELFCAVVEHGSYMDAARHLFITQPSLSLQVKSLQKMLGAELLERRHNRMILTEVGRMTYEMARNMLALERQLKSTVADLIRPDYGSLAIGSSRPFGRNFIADAVSDFVSRHEEVEVSVVYRDTEILYEQVVSRALDIGIVTGDDTIPIPPELNAVTLRHDHWCLVSSAHAPWADNPEVHFSLFQRAPLITGVVHSTHWKLIQKLLRDLGLHPGDYHVRLRMDDLESIKVVVLRGLGIAFLPHSTVQKELAEGALMEFRYPRGNPPLQCVIVHSNQQPLRPTVANFINFLAERFPAR